MHQPFIFDHCIREFMTAQRLARERENGFGGMICVRM
jgi:hypothetical protein